jgi:5-formyltetrahydrofolate cyclo-ligase
VPADLEREGAEEAGHNLGGGALHTKKEPLREALKRRLTELDPEDVASWSSGLCARVIESDAYLASQVVMLYKPLPGEADVGIIAEACLASGRSVCVPRIDWDRHELIPALVSRFDRGFVTRRYGVPEPDDSAPAVRVDDIDLIVTPGLAFDAQCWRLGRGGGFYDRLLARGDRRATTVGAAFDIQILDDLPRDQGDARLDAVATPSRWFQASGLPV